MAIDKQERIYTILLSGKNKKASFLGNHKKANERENQMTTSSVKGHTIRSALCPKSQTCPHVSNRKHQLSYTIPHTSNKIMLLIAADGILEPRV